MKDMLDERSFANAATDNKEETSKATATNKVKQKQNFITLISKLNTK